MALSSHDAGAASVASPHIPDPKGTPIHDWSLGVFDIGSWHIDFAITNTVFTTWVFMVVLFSVIACFYIAITTPRF